jgi:hypothetical protein
VEEYPAERPLHWDAEGQKSQQLLAQKSFGTKVHGGGRKKVSSCPLNLKTEVHLN